MDTCRPVPASASIVSMRPAPGEGAPTGAGVWSQSNGGGAVPRGLEAVKVKNVMSVDLEDWFCVYNLSRFIPYADWDKCESRVEQNTLRLLGLFRQRRVEATFFVLGWVADRFPDLVKEVERQGHEIATHGYSHRLLTFMEPEEFRVDLQRSLEALAKATSQEVRGFRAPSFSVTRKTLWAADILKESGIRYDSSVFPVRFHPEYGIADAELGPYQLTEGLTELPMGVAEVLGRRVPCCGGGYFRLYPYAVTRWLMRRCNEQRRPVMFYLHPWETDPEQPRVEGLSWSKRFRHYNNLTKTQGRIERLLDDFSFTSARKLLAERMIPSHDMVP
jgi:polysaccharide deacetylase family protein (PEP-CTERM system associated)